MTKPQLNSTFSKGKGRVFLEYVLFVLCLCVIALRATLTEGLSTQSVNQPINLSNNVYSLSISAVLIFSFVLWFVWGFCSREFCYRFSGIEAGLCVFVIAAVVAGLAASDKRTAVTDFAMLVAPVLLAILLVQILDSQPKIRLLLVVIVALGVVSAYQCADQFFSGNQMFIEQYEQAPQSMLEPLGIQPGTFSHWLFEQRLYSKDVRGFFTTGNSAGSFALLAGFAGIALFIEEIKSRKSYWSVPRRRLRFGFFLGIGVLATLLALKAIFAVLSLVKIVAPLQISLIISFVIAAGVFIVYVFPCETAVAIVIFGLALTHSKGAIAASLIAAVMFIAYLLFGNWLKNHKKAILVGCLLLVLAGSCAVVLYGLTYDRLPGGNSMLVRWQYWRSTGKMCAEHPLTGVGPGNFVHFYSRYKPSSAPETVADPHNFLLSILSQYGPIGLVGFLAMIVVPLWKVIFPKPASVSPQGRHSKQPLKLPTATFLIVVSAALLVVRPIVLTTPVIDMPAVMIYVVFVLYVMPVAVFVTGFLLLRAGTVSAKTANINVTTTALFCAVLGLLIHNLIDFAIFEPGVFTGFWAIMACLIAAGYHQSNRKRLVIKPAPVVKVIAAAVAVAAILVYLNYVLIPVAKTTAKIRQAYRAISNGRFEQAHNLLNSAGEDDCLSAAALSLNGRVYLQEFHSRRSGKTKLLSAAERCLLDAIERNRADYKNFERLADVYSLLAEASSGQTKADWLNKGFQAAQNAVERYPGSGRLRIKLGQAAEQLGKTGFACEQYRKAIEIEDSFRRQFQQMYPGQEVFSRLGEEKYEFAKQRLSECVDE